MEKIITVENLSRKYVTYTRGSGFRESLKSFFRRQKVSVDAVKDVSFYVGKGDIIGILGPNGAGKSTTIKMLTGTLYASTGNIQVMGCDPCRNRTEYVKNIGAVFGQKSQLVFDIPPIDSFRMNKAIYDISDKDYKERLDLLVELLGLEDKIFRPTRVLSLGERMKCEFIMAMLHNPDIVFLDEPTIGLDVIAKQTIRDFIKKMNEKGTTFILTTHDLQDVEQLAKNIIIINKGEKVFDGSIDELKRNLGNKKIIELTLTKKADVNRTGETYDLGIEGAAVIAVEEEHKLTIEVDIDRISINQFIIRLAELCEFSDISIKELPMEKVITTIYKG
ncbi:ABC transporter ATP-binding protein [Anaeromicropila populeti]|uniref:ABC-2 type transport system ATP-binding protein n=1 Tax=Anaeromicropila populeti TaxID=37658 RepID=A0A1I6JP34_9FIRM|nr:ATP-binding cassette domain-containing protein [Anaeromicropila populeti]SFR80681.1 ABC-2 type transport system ATP-binding protein [Anaeromicropila populeti]